MPSSYTTSLRLTLPATGELSGQWGNTVNTGITELLDAAVAGTASISTWGGAGVAYTLSNNSGTADEARKMFIVATGSPGEAKNVICPAVSKFYVFRNDTTGGYALTLKTSGGTGIAVPAGQYKFLYCDGTNVVEMFNSVGALTLSGALSVGGTATFAANPTLSAGTANQVQYLNGSKVLSGSANLTFDGTTLTGAGFSGPLNGSVGATTPSTGAFTTFSASSSVTLSGGTANGVLYLDGSKVATSGSALVFDGTNLGLGTSSPVAIGGYGIFTPNGVSGGAVYLQQGAATKGRLITTANELTLGTTVATNPIVFELNNAEQMRLTSTGLGIGTSSPSSTLHVQRASYGVTAIFQAQDGTGNPRLAVYGSSSGTTIQNTWSSGASNLIFANGGAVGSGTEVARFDSSGNLGIGTSSPSAKLTIAGTAATTSQVLNSTGSTTGATYGRWYNTGSDLVWGVESSAGGALLTGSSAYAATLYTNSAVPLQFGTAGTVKATLDSSGNLGLGVTPSAWQATKKAFQVGTVGSLSADAATAALGNNVYYNSGGSPIYLTSTTASYYYQNSGQHVWLTAPSGTAGNTISFTQAMTLDASGRLLIGFTTAPTGSVGLLFGSGNQVHNSGGGGFANLSLSGGGQAFYTYTGAVGTETYTERARITSGGDLLVGTTSNYTAARLAIERSNADIIGVRGNSVGSGFRYDTTDGTGTVAYFTTNSNTNVAGSITVSSTTTTYNTTSDYRLKDNPQPLTNSGAFIDALQPKTWDWKADGSRGVGFIAHEVQAVSPTSVVGEKDAVDADGKPVMQAMEYGSAEFIANIIAELQSLRARVAALEAQP